MEAGGIESRDHELEFAVAKDSSKEAAAYDGRVECGNGTGQRTYDSAGRQDEGEVGLCERRRASSGALAVEKQERVAAAAAARVLLLP